MRRFGFQVKFRFSIITSLVFQRRLDVFHEFKFDNRVRELAGSRPFNSLCSKIVVEHNRRSSMPIALYWQGIRLELNFIKDAN